jgi:glycosyltransferase involved in cell wall biosynthesis
MLVSVVVCTKNEEKYVKRCLECLKNQTVKPEIVIVDAHSTDKTVKIAKKYTDIIVQDNRKGVADARNVGWKTAKGEIVAYCDADCLVPIDWVEKIARYMKNNICVFGPIIPYEGSNKVKFGLKVFGDLFLEASDAFKYPCICAANMAVRRDILKKYPFRFEILEDFDIGNRLRKVGKVKFYKDLYVFISTRRFKDSFHRKAFKNYLLNYFRLKTGREMKTEYAKKMGGA